MRHTVKPSASVKEVAKLLLEEDSAACTLDELCLSCNVNPDWIAGLVEYGVIEPIGRTRSAWQFTTLSIVRVAKAKRLERDLGLNLPGVALALDLPDQLDEMRAIERQKEVAPRR